MVSFQYNQKQPIRKEIKNVVDRGHLGSFKVIFPRSLSKSNLKLGLKMVYSGSTFYFDSITWLFVEVREE